MEGRRKSTRASSRATSVDNKKNKTEKEKDQVAASVDHDVESVSSGSSMTECKVVLDRLSSASFNTRSRLRSNLTIDNVAAIDSPVEGKRSKASGSVASDDTGFSRTRASSRLSASQNTPKKEAKSTTTRVAAATPTRRRSRLNECIDLTNSPVIPARRALRSNSVASEDLAPASPSTRRSTRSSRLADTQGTPNKAKVESESVMTPSQKGRASRLFTRQVQEIKEEEEDTESISIIDLGGDASQSAPNSKNKKNGTANSETQASSPEINASSRKIETVSVETMESEKNVLLVQTSTSSLIQLNESPKIVAQSGDSETLKKLNQSSDSITETSKQSNDLNAVVDTSILGENATSIGSLQSDQTLPKEKSSDDNKMVENVKNDAIIADESTLDREKVDSINVNASISGEPDTKSQSKTSMESALVINDNRDNSPDKGSKAFEKSSTSEKKTPLMKSRRNDLNFMFQGAAKESPVSSKFALTPKQLDESSVSVTDQTMHVEKLQTPQKDSTVPKTPSKNDLSLMNVTELVNSPKPDTNIIKPRSNQSKSPKANTPSKNISEFADMDVTSITSPLTSIIEKATTNKGLTPKQNNQTTEPDDILNSMNVTELVNSPKPIRNIQETGSAETLSPKPKHKDQTADSTNALDLMNVTEIVNSPKTNGMAGAIEQQSPQSKTMSPKQNIQTTEPTTVAQSVDMNVTESSDVNVSGAEGIEIETPKKVSSKQNTPKSTPVSDQICTPKNKTPKAKTPSKDLNELGGMNVNESVEKVTEKTITPKKTEKNVPASVPETVAQNTESEKIESANNQMAKSPSSTRKTKTPKKSPLSSTLADQSINLNLEISKICESLQSPNETETKTTDIFAIPIDDGKTLDNTVEPMDVDQTQIGNMTSISISEQPDNQLDADDNNVSSVSVSSRKSVQIMTPKAAKNTSGLNRLGTPYPDKKEIDAALSREEEIRNTATRFMGYVKNYQEELKSVSESWNQSQKRVSAGKNAGTSGVDTLDSKKDKVNEQPAKVAIPARNNWSISKGLIDSESEPEPETGPEPEESEKSDEESEHSGLFDDKAEAIDDYESGDSENEEDRQYRKENELEHAEIDLGSDDTENELSDDDSSIDSFIVKDSDEGTQESDTDDSDRNEPVVRGRRFNRIVSEETSSDEGEEIVSVSMGVVHQVVVFGQDTENSEEMQMVEGKKFGTTIFKDTDEEKSIPKEQEKLDETAQVSHIENESVDKSTETSNESITESTEEAKELENVSNMEEKSEKTVEVVEIRTENIQQDELNEPTTSEMPKEIDDAENGQPTAVQTEAEKTLKAPEVQEDDIIEPCDSKWDQNETVHESNESDVSSASLKENETVQMNVPNKPKRLSLSGIKSLPDSGLKMAERINRKSLGDLIPNQQVLFVSPARVIHDNSSLLKKQMPKASKQAEPKEPVSENSATENYDVQANTSVTSMDSKVVHSQEENNNKKSVKGIKAKRLAKTSEKHSTTQSFEEQDSVTDAAVPCSSKSTMSVDSNDFKKTKKQKRKFIEIETESEPSSPSRKPTKYLNIIESRSGKFIEEPMTPEKQDRLGFKVTPMTPVNKAFRVEKLHKNGINGQLNKSKKRKIVQIEEPAIVLPKPHWTIEQDNVQPKKRARNILTGNTEMIVKPLNERKRIKSARDLIPAELQRFRERNLYRAGIPRQDSRSLLMDRVKRIASQK